MKVLVTGGLGYIGSHTVIDLIEKNHDICIVDNLSNCEETILTNLSKITGKLLNFSNCDLNDVNKLSGIFSTFKPNIVIHFAAKKSAPESILDSLSYYENNVSGTINLLKIMDIYNCRKIIFSSSASVYGVEAKLPFTEASLTKPINPYGSTKLIVEKILKDWIGKNKDKSAIALRYFNPIGAHKSKLLGEKPKGTPNNLMPNICQVALGNTKYLKVFGNDFNTRDGSGERDFIHIADLTNAHVIASEYSINYPGFDIFNVGTGKGTTVFELIKSFEIANQIKIKFKILKRRAGDPDSCYASVAKIKKTLNWKPSKTLIEMCEDSWNWALENSKN